MLLAGVAVAVVLARAEGSSESAMLGGAFWITPPWRNTFCSNFRSLIIDYKVFKTSSSGECGELCLDRAECAEFSWQENPCFGSNQEFQGACVLLKAGCERVANVCWDLFAMRRGGESRCLDGDEMLSTDSANPALSTFSQAENPLNALLGRWSNAPAGWKPGDTAPDVQGFNVVRLPDFNANGFPFDPAQTASFAQLSQRYVEVIEFTPILGAVRNRGYGNANHFNPPCQLDQFFLGVKYVQQVTDIDSGVIIHDENGQWLFNMDPGVVVDWSVARLALIPHGQAVEALGLNSTLYGAQAIKDDIAATMTDQGRGVQFSVEPRNDNLPPGTGYAAVAPPFDGVQSLLGEIDAADAPGMIALKLDVTTTASRGPAGGSIGQLPNPKAQAFTEQFNHTYWVESWTDAYGKKQMQIQYVQTMDLTFQAAFNDPTCQSAYPGLDCLIKWPHFDINTLRKIADYPFPPAPSPPWDVHEKLPIIR